MSDQPAPEMNYKQAEVGQSNFAQPSSIDDVDMKANRVDAPSMDSDAMRAAQQSSTPDLPSSQQPDAVKTEIEKNAEVDQLNKSTDQLEKTIDELEAGEKGPLMTTAEESEMVKLSREVASVENHVKQLSNSQNRLMQEDDKWLAMQAIVEMISMLIRKLTGTLEKGMGVLTGKLNDPDFKNRNPAAHAKAVENHQKISEVLDMTDDINKDLQAKVKEQKLDKDLEHSAPDNNPSPTPY